MTDLKHDIDADFRWRDSKWRSRFRRDLLRWFDRNARTLPWRGTNDPYRVWISEIMLQQTQVSTVIPYYERFIDRFDDVASLADAEEQEVLRYWEGLGYYRRARQMHAAARKVMSDHDGIFPTNFDDVFALPGIGRYTAGAILSISLDQRHPVVEANTLRLYSRLMALRSPTNKPAGQNTLWEFATAILPRRGSGTLNQAAMELGSLICKPREPSCLLCPVVQWCAAQSLGLQDSIPGKVKQLQYESRREWPSLSSMNGMCSCGSAFPESDGRAFGIFRVAIWAREGRRSGRAAASSRAFWINCQVTNTIDDH
ncbi:MAG: A/G-specific adenine glycosylase [Pirellulaceae bacterium]